MIIIFFHSRKIDAERAPFSSPDFGTFLARHGAKTGARDELGGARKQFFVRQRRVTREIIGRNAGTRSRSAVDALAREYRQLFSSSVETAALPFASSITSGRFYVTYRKRSLSDFGDRDRPMMTTPTDGYPSEDPEGRFQREIHVSTCATNVTSSRHSTHTARNTATAARPADTYSARLHSDGILSRCAFLQRTVPLTLILLLRGVNWQLHYPYACSAGRRLSR